MELQPLITKKGKLVFNCGHSLKYMAMQSEIINDNTYSRCLICDKMQEFPTEQLKILSEQYPGEYDQVYENTNKLFARLVLPTVVEVFYGDHDVKLL